MSAPEVLRNWSIPLRWYYILANGQKPGFREAFHINLPLC